MKNISTALPVSKTPSEVARYIDLQLRAMAPKSQAQIADEAGLPQRNLLSMIRSGQTKLPFERIKGISKALKVDQGHLFRLALEAYQPHIKELLDEAGLWAISRHEKELIAIWRQATIDSDPPVAPLVHEIRAMGERARETAHR